MIVGLGGINGGLVREERFVIMPASEIMAILCLATDLQDLEARLAASSSASRATGSRSPPADLKAAGRDGAAAQGRDAARTSCRRSRAGPALVHGGPFGNIAHGCNSIIATQLGLALGDIVVTEAGFGSDLGAEKFFDIKCRFGGLNPEAAVIVATVRALKMHGGAKKDGSARPTSRRSSTASPTSRRHVENVAEVRRAGRRGAQPLHLRHRRGTEDRARRAAKAWGARVALSDVWAKGGEGGEAVAKEVLAILDEKKAAFKPLYDVEPADQGQDRDHREGDLRRRRRRLLARGRARPSSRSRGWASATRPSAWPRPSTPSATTPPSSGALGLPHDGTRCVCISGRRLRRGAGRRHHDHAGTVQDAIGGEHPCSRRRHHRGIVLDDQSPVHTDDAPGGDRPLQPGHRVRRVRVHGGPDRARSVHHADRPRRRSPSRPTGSCTNLAAVLEAAGSDLSRVVKTTVFLRRHGRLRRDERDLRPPLRRAPPARVPRWR